MSTETVKKTKAPAKPKTAVKTQADASAVKAAPAVKAVKAAAKTKTVDVAATSAPSYTEIAQLAQRYWAERGYHDGQAGCERSRSWREQLRRDGLKLQARR